jgi:RluA family pseudouridine synthase
MGEGVWLVFEDEHVLVIDKPTGLNSVPPEGQDVESVFGVVKEWAKKRGGKRERGERAAWIVHRLDKEVSGLMVFAKTQRAFEHLKEELRVRRVQREYVMVVPGALPEGETHSVEGFVREGADGIMKHVPSQQAGGRNQGQAGGDEGDDKHALTHLRVVRTGKTRSLVAATLDTGRKNQIRVHMQAIARPICGDRRFGSTDDPLGRVCLHAMKLSFAHPVTGKALAFESPMPTAFDVTLGGLREGEKVQARESLKGAAGAKQRANETDSTQRGAAKQGAEKAGSEKNAATAKGAGQHDALQSSWDHVAGWYDDYIERRTSDHHEQVIVPGTIRLLGATKGQRVLDVACGQGILCRALREQGVTAYGVDAAPGLIERARAMDKRGVYEVGDARALEAITFRGGTQELFDGVSCVMALMNIEPLRPVMQGVAQWLKPRGVFVAVMLHPAFRSPGQTSWEWAKADAIAERPATNSRANKRAKFNDARGGTGRGSESRVMAARERAEREAKAASWESAVQYRRVDGYLSPNAKGIVMNPGGVAKGEDAVTTMTYHRPLQTYVKAFAEAGLLLNAMEEWASVRMSEPGPRAAAENRARREIPMFVAMRGVKT